MFIFKLAIKNILTKLWAYVSKCLIAFFDGIMKLRRFIIPVVAWIKRLRRSILLSVLLIVSNYFINNFPYITDNILPLWPFELITHAKQKPKFDESSVLFVNVGSDKEDIHLTLRMNYAGDTVKVDTFGTRPITDRGKLLDFLKIIKKSYYRYCFIDVRFEDSLEVKSVWYDLATTPNDSALFAELETMKNCVIATHADICQVQQLKHKTAYADFLSTFTGGLITRYNFLQAGDKHSIALKMHNDLNGEDVSRFGCLYFSNGSLCTNSKFLTIPTGLREKETLSLGELLKDNSPETLMRLMNEKIIVIGDFDEDKHSTYVGDVPGSLLSFLAYQELKCGNHKVSFLEILTLFAFYMLISFLLYERDSFGYHFPKLKRINNRPFRFFLSLISWGGVLGIIDLIFYLLYDNVICQIAALVAFQTISTIQSNKKKY